MSIFWLNGLLEDTVCAAEQCLAAMVGTAGGRRMRTTRLFALAKKM